MGRRVQQPALAAPIGGISTCQRSRAQEADCPAPAVFWCALLASNLHGPVTIKVYNGLTRCLRAALHSCCIKSFCAVVNTLCYVTMLLSTSVLISLAHLFCKFTHHETCLRCLQRSV